MDMLALGSSSEMVKIRSLAGKGAMGKTTSRWEVLAWLLEKRHQREDLCRLLPGLFRLGGS